MSRWNGPYITFWNQSRDLGWEHPAVQWKPRHWECAPNRIPPGTWTTWTIHDFPENMISVSVRFGPDIWSDCCQGTGFADYAAVPCPNPECPVLMKTQWDAKGDSDGDDDSREENPPGDSEDGVQHG